MNSEPLEAALADFRNWFAEWEGLEESDFPEPSVDFAALVGGFAALRHEVNLQTKSARAALEQTAETVKLLQEKAATPKPETDVARPFVKALIDVYDQLSLAAQGVEKRRETSTPAPAPPPAPGFWGKLFRAKPSEPVAVTDSVRETIEALLTGYRMSMSRIDRLLVQQGLETITVIDQPFDPETMEAIEVVAGSDKPSGTVVTEIRRGYRWKGQMFRFAQVTVAR